MTTSQDSTATRIKRDGTSLLARKRSSVANMSHPVYRCREVIMVFVVAEVSTGPNKAWLGKSLFPDIFLFYLAWYVVLIYETSIRVWLSSSLYRCCEINWLNTAEQHLSKVTLQVLFTII